MTRKNKIKELRDQIKTMANVAMEWKNPDDKTRCDENFLIPSDKFVTNGIVNVHQRLCSLSDKVDMTVVNVMFDKGGYIPPHTHDRIEKTYVLDGEYYDPVAKKNFYKGDIQVVHPKQVHASISDYCLLTCTWEPAYPVEKEE